MNGSRHRPTLAFALLFTAPLLLSAHLSRGQQASPAPQQPTPAQPAPTQPAKSSSSRPPLIKPPSESEELQQAIETAGNDRAALLHNLEDFLKKYPESRQRPQIYRALVEASLQLRDSMRATEYAERVVALMPEDMSMTLLAIQLLERNGDEPALRRALNYSNRVLNYIELAGAAEKSPKVSREEWEAEQKREKTNVFALRGRLYFKLHDNADAAKDFRSSMELMPTAAAAEKLGEIAELSKDLNGAIREYAHAFVLSDPIKGADDRRDIRKKLGNVWRLAHGSEQGLGDFLLQAYDASIASADSGKPKRNPEAKEPYDFKLRNARDGSPYLLGEQKGKILVVNFWATWCGPCRAMEPHFEHVAAQFQGSDIVFLAADCDEDETLVPAYLEEVKPHTTVVFADGLDRLLAVKSFPTVVVLDRTGKIAYRAEGFDPEDVERELSSAVRRVLAAGNEKDAKQDQGVKSGV